MRAAVSLVALACFIAPPTAAAGDVVVERRGDALRVMASAAPLADVLSAFERETGARVTYEGAAPRMLVTFAFDAGTPVEAVTRMFEGLGLSYVVGLDDRGSSVNAMFVLSGAGASGSARAATAPVMASAQIEDPVAMEAIPDADVPAGATDDFQEVARPRAMEDRAPAPQDDGERSAGRATNPPPNPAAGSPGQGGNGRVRARDLHHPGGVDQRGPRRPAPASDQQ